jgi:hypothetical protein
MLVSVPLYTLWRVKLPRKQRHLILSIFAAGAISSLPAIAFGVVMIKPEAPVAFKWVCYLTMVIHIKVYSFFQTCFPY